MKTHIETLQSARRQGVPLIIWNTADPFASVTAISNALNGDTPIMTWDVLRGTLYTKQVSGVTIPEGMAAGNPGDFLKLAATYLGSRKVEGPPVKKLPGTLAIMLGAHKFTSNPMVLQGVSNLRDAYKADGRTLILMAPQLTPPQEWVNDVLVIEEPLPERKELAGIVAEQLTAAGVRAFSPDAVEDMAGALTGLSAFAAEQSVALSISKDAKGAINLDRGELWERKRKTVEATKGLTIWRGGETLADIAGIQTAKDFATMYWTGEDPANAIVFIDEIEKSGAVAGTHDTSSTSQDQHGVVLQAMQDDNSEGILCIGHPGSAKSMFAKALGNTFNVPTIRLDLGAMKASHVGESEAGIRNAMKIIKSVSGGKALYIATCNQVSSLSPELRRRFTLGTFFFDLPDEKERGDIWKLYVRKYKLKESAGALAQAYAGWTGADIANCCKRAWMFRIGVDEAAKFATPLCQTNPQAIEDLQMMANGAFLSASHPGLYKKPAQQSQPTTKRSYASN